MGLIGRIYNIAKSNIVNHTGSFEKLIDKALNSKNAYSRPRDNGTDYQNHSDSYSGAGGSTFGGYGRRTSGPGFDYASKQVADDLKVFNLSPPSSMEEVKRARNREIKKYHSDKFINDPDKFETSKQIMQVYNAAYDRLKKHYGK